MVNLKQCMAGTGSAMFAKSTYSRWPLSSFYSHWPFFPVVSHCTSCSLMGQIFLGAGEAGLAYLFPPLACYIVLELSWLVHPSFHGLVASHHTFLSADGNITQPRRGVIFFECAALQCVREWTWGGEGWRGREKINRENLLLVGAFCSAEAVLMVSSFPQEAVRGKIVPAAGRRVNSIM